MTVLKEEIAKRVKGALMENEDWWWLCYDTETGKYHIQHDWSHVDAYNVAKGVDSGSAVHAADDWTGASSEDLAKAKLNLLAKAGK